MSGQPITGAGRVVSTAQDAAPLNRSHAPCLAGFFMMMMTVKVTTNLGQASVTVEGPHGP